MPTFHNKLSTSSSSTSSSSSYQKRLKQKRKQKRHKRSRNKASASLSDTLLSKEYCLNRYNLLRGFSLIVCLTLFFISLLYCSSSLYKLELADFWCQEYSYDEILQHNRALNSSKGLGNCYRDENKGLYADHSKLFSKNDKSDAFVAKIESNVSGSHIIKLLLFSIPVCGFLSLFFYYLLICFIDCNKTIKNEWSDKRRRSTFLPNKEIYCCCYNDSFFSYYFPQSFDNYVKCYRWIQKKFGVDKPVSVFLLLVKEMVEIFLQS